MNDAEVNTIRLNQVWLCLIEVGFDIERYSCCSRFDFWNGNEPNGSFASLPAPFTRTHRMLVMTCC